MKHHAIKNRNAFSALEMTIFGLSSTLGVGISTILGIYSILKSDLNGIFLFGIIFLFSLGVFLYVQDKTKIIET